MKLKYILMCALAMIGIAMQAQNNVRYEISSTPATEVVEGHYYVLRNRANQEEVLTYSDNNIASITEWESIPFGNCMEYQNYFIAAGADGFTLPITLDNVNRYFGPGYAGTGYGETEGGTVIGPKRKAADNTVYFTVKDADGQYVLLDKNYGLMGANATKIAENAQWIAYEAKVHTQHVWEYREGYDGHVCRLCDQQESHNVPDEDGKCTVCDYTCPEHNYSFNDRASILATKEQGKSIMVYECNNCHYQKTMPLETEGECEGNEFGHEWNEYSYDPTCAMPGYTEHHCVYCVLEYYTDFTDIEPDNHFWIAESDGHFCANYCAEHGASWAEHTMADGKCTVCGYWPGHTEHQWLTDSNGHFCTIPGCEYSVYELHTTEEGSCACTVCGHIEHRYQNGVCQNCRIECQHKWKNDGYCNTCGTQCDHSGRIVPAAVIPATCTKEGWKEHFECSVCHKLFANEEGESIWVYYEDLHIEKLGHVIGEDKHCHREGCDAEVSISSTTITLGEAANVDFMDCSQNLNSGDPTAAPLYQLDLTQPAQYIFSIPEEMLNSFDSPCVSIFNNNFECFGTLSIDPESTNSAFFEEAGTYYLLPSAFGDGEKEFVKRNVPLTIAIVNTITLDPSITDDQGNEVVITRTEDGSYATTQTIALNDAVNIPYTDIEFTVPAVSYTRDISAYTGSDWGTLCLPFDYTVADATSAGLSIYEFTAASAEAVTVTHKTEGTVKYGTPVLFKKTGEGEGASLTLSATSTKMGFDKGVIDDISGLQLWGTFEPTPVTSGYYLDAKDGKLHSIETYCSEKSKASLPIPAYRAYFAGNVSPSGAPLRINIDDDEATAIAAISALTEGKAEIYDMNGRRIQSLQKGVNIMKYGNGKSIKVNIK